MSSLNSFSFKEIPFIDHCIKNERQQHKRRRQVVSVLLLCPHSTKICLTRAKASDFDGDHRWSPPQGKIGRNENLFSSAFAHLKNELKVNEDQCGKPHYLGSILRKINPSEGRGNKYDEYHYHFVLVQSHMHQLTCGKSVADARWCHSCELRTWVEDAMSAKKAQMFLAAFDKCEMEMRHIA